MIFKDNEADRVYETLTRTQKFIIFLVTPIMFVSFMAGVVVTVVKLMFRKG